MDLNNLTKEQLLALLKQANINTPEQPTSQTENQTNKETVVEVENRCKYHAKGRKDSCPAEATTEYGFCTKHRNTIQGKNARKAYEEKKELKRKAEEAKKKEEEEKLKVEEEEEEYTDEEEEDEEEEEELPSLVAKRNKWGNYVHQPTGICFDIRTKKAIGTQGRAGKIFALTRADKHLCDEWRILYSDSEDEYEESDDEEY